RLSSDWVIEASIQRPRDPTHGMRYRVLAVHRAKVERQEGMSGTPYGERQGVGISIWPRTYDVVLLGRDMEGGHDEGERLGCT
ncbi:UNVERIFIED_CONTAM: hypothetical protein Sindi_2271100, partial [Sesamum indicum]